MLITTGQPSCNPRIVKEADAFTNAGHDVMVLYCFYIRWAAASDLSLLQKANWKFKMVGGSPFRNKVQFFFTRMRNRFCRLLNQLNILDFLIAERTEARCYDELIHAAKKIKADWYIAHNLGALPVAVKAAAFHKSKCGFDFEDYHRGEILPGDSVNFKRIIYLEMKCLKLVNYISAASPMILDSVLKDLPVKNITSLTINNCFPLAQQPLYRERSINDNHLRLFWFSQTVGVNRGLEVLIEAMLKNHDLSVSLTLAGRCNKDLLTYISQHPRYVNDAIHYAGIIEPDKLPAFAAQFDVGLAIESGIPLNRDICLTNKIFTYLLGGNALILSETSMQAAFNKTYKVGQTFAVKDVQALADKINMYKNFEQLEAQRKYNYVLAKEQLNWEKESKKLLPVLL